MSIRLQILTLAIITFLVYSSSFSNQFVWDDEQFIYKNNFVATFDVARIFTTNTVAGAGELSNYYRPLTTLSFAVDYQFWGLNPFGYHLVNTFLHIGVGIFLLVLLQQLSMKKTISFWIALFFLIHPVQTEAVTYINSRGDSLYSFFGVAGLVAYTLGIKKNVYRLRLYNLELDLNSKFWNSLAVILFILSILSKEIGLALLGVFGMILVWFYTSENQKVTVNNLKIFYKKHTGSLATLLALIAVVLSYMSLRATVLNFQNTFNFFDDSSLYSNSMVVRLLTFSKIILIYIKIIFIPFPLHMERSVSLVTEVYSPWVVITILLVGLLLSLGWYQWQRKKSALILFGTGWFFSMLVPVSGVIAINGLLYEHWLYLPIIGFFIIIYGCYQLASVKGSKTLLYLGIIIAIIYAILTIRQNYFWSSPVRLYTYLLRYTDSARIHNNLAMALSEEGKFEEALKEYGKALEFGMQYPQIYHNMANTYVTLNKLDLAEEYYLKALTIDKYFYHSYNNLLSLYTAQQRYDEALKIVTAAQSSYPTAVEYAVKELNLYSLMKDKTQFEQRKTILLQQYNSDQTSKALLNCMTM